MATTIYFLERRGIRLEIFHVFPTSGPVGLGDMSTMVEFTDPVVYGGYGVGKVYGGALSVEIMFPEVRLSPTSSDLQNLNFSSFFHQICCGITDRNFTTTSKNLRPLFPTNCTYPLEYLSSYSFSKRIL